MSDLIDRQEAISRAVELRMYGKPVKMVAVSELERLPKRGETTLPEQADSDRLGAKTGETCEVRTEMSLAEERTDKRTKIHTCDLQPTCNQLATDTISRQAAIDIFDDYNVSVENGELEAYSRDRKRLCDLPSAQPERTCVNCGRTINNGGWYADGKTRCPIEEHYALPKDGYCHLWEKRNVTDDDYPERRIDEPEK